jgi:hypothetical protein
MLDPATVQVLFADLRLQIVARSKTNAPDALTRSGPYPSGGELFATPLVLD